MLPFLHVCPDYRTSKISGMLLAPLIVGVGSTTYLRGRPHCCCLNPDLLWPRADSRPPPVLSKQQKRRRNMSGYFEIIDVPDGGFRTRLRGPSGELLAVSESFPTKRQAAAGIGLIREVAGTGLIRDMSSGHRGEPFRRRLRLLRAQSGRTAFGQPRAAQADPTVHGTVTARTTLQRTGSRRWHSVT